MGVKASEVRKFQSPQPAGRSTREGDETGCLLGTVLPYGGTDVIQDPRRALPHTAWACAFRSFWDYCHHLSSVDSNQHPG